MSEMILSVIALTGFVLSIVVFVSETLPSLVAEHRARQESRLKWDGYQPVWFMCWTYWFGLEKLVFGPRIRTAERLSAYLRHEFD